MAEDSQSFSHTDTTNKRKFDEPPPSAPPPPRRSTGFSSPIISANASYNSVPPPMDEIQIAKQKAQEIVARLFNNAESKRARLEDGTDNVPIPDSAQKPPIQPVFNSQGGSVPFMAQPGPYFGFQGSNKKMDIPNGKVGVIIGKGGETIKYLQLQSGAKIQVTRDTEADPYSQTREVELIGTSEQISRAEQLIKDVIAETDAGGSGTGAARGFANAQYGNEQFSMKVPNNKVALIIGKGGETIKNMQNKSGARIQVIPLHLPPGDTSTERTVHISGTNEQTEAAKELINEIINSESRMRNPSMSGNYMQQSYGPRPPASWGPPGPPPMQQPGYGYMQQPGAYSGPPQPYYTSYDAYSQQSSGWDQASAAGSAQPPQPAPAAGYDYYGQQSQTVADPANGSYGYPQAATNIGVPSQGSYTDQGYSQQSQNYGQDGYGSQTAAPSSQSSAVSGQYDQQQQYMAPGYGPPGAPPVQPDGSTAQPYGTQASTTQLPSAQPVAYTQLSSTLPPSQGYSQVPYTSPSYGQQPGQKPPASQPLFAQGGYPQPGPPQTNYGSTDQAGNPVTYEHSQDSLGPPVYGAGAQGSYGQQQQSYSGGNVNANYSSISPVNQEGGKQPQS